MIAHAGGYEEPIQQKAPYVFDCVCPDWTKGVLDNLLQWGRNNITGFDWWLIISAILGGAIMIVAFPPTRQVLKAAVETIRVIWNKTKGRE